jgi:hypothetical protein
MSEWQPARLCVAHRDKKFFDGRPKVGDFRGKIVHIRETSFFNLAEAICDAEKYYSVLEAPGYAACEHEILTD